MKIAVTGGSGFIGTRLIALLREAGHEIVIIDLVHDQPIDILHQDKLNAACEGCDVIYHLAAAHRDDIFPRSIYYETNGQGTRNVIKAAEAHNINHIIFTSTVAVYGLNSGTPTEDSETKPFNDYGKSKLEAEKYLQAWAVRGAGNKATIVRPVVVFGENNRGNVHTLINQITRGKFLMIGEGQNKKSMAYVGNIAAFLKHCLDETENIKIYNYADKPDFTTRELVNVIYHHLNLTAPSFKLPYILGLSAGYAFDVLARVSGKQLPVSSVRIQKFCADTSVISEKCFSTGYQPQYSLTEGVERMINHDFASDIKSKIKSEIKGDIKSEIKSDIKSEIKSDIKSEIKGDIKSEIKQNEKAV